MKLQFTEENIKEISETLGVAPASSDGSWTWSLSNKDNGQSLIVSLYNDVLFADEKSGAMVSVQSIHGYFELHDLTAFVAFEPDEVIFIRHDDELLSSMVVGKGSTCSLYSNINRSMLKKDLTELDPTVLLSAMQLSIADGIISDK